MGFSRGLGLKIAASVISEVQPSTVVQIQSKHGAKNFRSLLTTECVQCNLLPCSTNTHDLNYKLVTLASMSDNCSGFDFQPRQIREMCVLAYLSQMFPPSVLSLTDPSVPIFRYV